MSDITLDRDRPLARGNGKAVSGVKSASRLLKAMSNESRLVVLSTLAQDGEASVGALEPAVGLSQSALSQHLARLRRDGLVTTRRDAQTIYYSLASDEVRTVLTALSDLYGDR